MAGYFSLIHYGNVLIDMCQRKGRHTTTRTLLSANSFTTDSNFKNKHTQKIIRSNQHVESYEMVALSSYLASSELLLLSYCPSSPFPFSILLVLLNPISISFSILLI